MMRRLLPVDKHIPRRARQLNIHPIHVSRDMYLTPEAAGVGQSECEIEHVVFVVRGFGEAVILFRWENNVASRAGNRTFAGT